MMLLGDAELRMLLRQALRRRIEIGTPAANDAAKASTLIEGDKAA